MNVTIQCTDALSFLRSIDAESVAGVATDPPYSSGGGQRDTTKRTGAKYCNTQSASRNLPDFRGETMDQVANLQFSYFWLLEAFRVLRPSGYVMLFTDWRQLTVFSSAVQMAGFTLRGVCVWDKTAGSRPQRCGFRNQSEFIIWATKGAKRTNGDVYAEGVFRKSNSQRGRVHQTQKPIELMEWLLSVIEPGAPVLDPFLGSGSTGVAAVRSGRDFYGCEVVPDIFATAEHRIKEELENVQDARLDRG